MVRSEGITVVTVTRGRPDLLRRATRSIASQDVDAPVQHLVIVDDCNSTAIEIGTTNPYVYEDSDVLFVERRSAERTGPARLGYLRNLSVSRAAYDWIAFLDDDNEFDNDHLSSLLTTARATSRPAVHSHRRLYLPDGEPFTEPIFPWCRDRAFARAEYQRLLEAGVFVAGDNVVRDAVDASRGVQMVDMGEWLLERRLLATVGFQERYTDVDWERVVPEDNKLLRELVARGVPLATTGRPTLRYYLGGYSNGAMITDDLPVDTWVLPSSISSTASPIRRSGDFS